MVFTNHIFAVWWAKKDGAIVWEFELAHIAGRGDSHNILKYKGVLGILQSRWRFDTIFWLIHFTSMYHLSCKDVSGLSCPYKTDGDSEIEVIDDVKDHVFTKHEDHINTMMDDEEMTEDDLEDKMQMMITMS